MEPLANYFSFDLKKNLIDSNSCKLIGCLIKEILNAPTANEDLFLFVTSIVNKIITDYKERGAKKNVEKKEEQEEQLISHAITHRFVKTFVIEYANYSGPHKEFYQAKIDDLYEFILKELAVLINTKAVFVVIALVEFTHYKDQVLISL